MSLEATRWARAHSRHRGAFFSVHVALADRANDAHRNEIWMSVATIAAAAHVSERTVQRALQRLVSDGDLEVVARAPGQTVRYRLLMPDPRQGVTPDKVSPPTSRQGTPDKVSPGTPDKVSPKPKEGLNRRNTSSNGERAGTRGESDDFDRFWSAYPAKKSKGTARKAWAKAITNADPDTIIAGALRYRDDDRVRSGYVQNPATWLNAEGWLDEATPRKQTASASRQHLDDFAERARRWEAQQQGALAPVGARALERGRPAPQPGRGGATAKHLSDPAQEFRAHVEEAEVRLLQDLRDLA